MKYHNCFRLVGTFFLFKASAGFYFSVFDGVIKNARAVDDFCKIKEEETVGSTVPHSLIDRRKPPANIVEAALDSILKELDDSCRFIEWWWRDEWRHLELHRDLDEHLAREDPGNLRCPEHGHVLYLDVGEDCEGGPTVLWKASSEPTALDISEMTVVPAISGRLLRFSGSALHSVPRPPISYLASKDGGTGGIIHTRTRRVPGDEESTLRRRSVILFNTWPTSPAGFEDSTCDQLEPYSSDEPLCSGREEWEVAADSKAGMQDTRGIAEPEIKARIKVGLLGDRIRRGTPERHFVGWGSGSDAISALQSTKDVKTVPIYLS
eukprot:CAMPEP_0172590154 /NCGR_PEP_ID=MMETSP1068-20121228/8586_1 /TAXON_ID=35684 /ORGANISM="Pseudopedinella elastica, Strain CCMP716" /LENGTH=321 /DNA_ID=CAMNT_0013385855 /DNA_START=27 /DNA_END=992 /DNA_ORIENTATION=+